MPQLRPRVRGRARPGAACLGRRRRDDGRRGVARRCRTRRRRSSRRRSLEEQIAAQVPQPAGAPARPRRLLLRARRRDPRARGASRPPRGRLDRRARRPQHAGDARLRATRGGCRCGWRSTRAPSRPRTSRSSAPATSIRPRSRTWRRPGSTTTSIGRSRAATGLRGVRLRRAPAGRARGLHARARRPDARARPRRCSQAIVAATRRSPASG